MGEVCRARDTRLGRTLALKVSKTDFSDRFEGEAHAIGALNHPNICTQYDVGPNYLVMEYIEGTPLRGTLPAEKAVDSTTCSRFRIWSRSVLALGLHCATRTMIVSWN